MRKPLKLPRLIAEVLGLLEGRFEFFRGGDQNFHFFAKVEKRVVAVEVMSRTHLGKISETPLFEEVRHVEREGVFYWTLSLEAYAVLQATRRDGPRDVDLARFVLVFDEVNWGRAGRLAERLGVGNRFKAERKTEVVPVPPEEVLEVVRLGAERVVYAFCKAAGVIV